MFFDMINYAYYLIPCIHLYTRPTLVSNNKSLQLDHWNFLILYLTYAICVCGRGKHSWFAAFTVCTNCRYLEIGIEIAAKIISIRNTTHINPKGFLMGFSVIPRSPQTFRPVPAMKLLGIMFKYRCWPTTFHTITAGDANGWCYNWLVRSASHAPITPNFLHPVSAMKLLGIMFTTRCWPTTFHTITAGDSDVWCRNRPVRSAPHAPTTPNFTFGPSREIVDDYVQR